MSLSTSTGVRATSRRRRRTARDALGDLAADRGALKYLVGRDLKVKYETSLLGYLWSVLEPLLLTAVYYVVFSLVGRFAIEDYPLYLIAGMLPWLWVASTVNAATTAMTRQARLIKRVRLPREVFPFSVVVAKGSEYVASYLVILLFAAIAQRPPTWAILLQPLVVLLQGVALTGVALLLSSINVMLRDVQRLVRIVLRVVFYLSPIVYPVSLVAERGYLDLYRLNPLVGIIELHRWAWFAEFPPGPGNVVAAVIGSFVLLAVGWTTFSRLERAVLKEL